MTPDQIAEIEQRIREHTPAELAREIGSGVLAESLAGYLQLIGIKIGSGDLNMAMAALGLILCQNAGDGTLPPNGTDQLSDWCATVEATTGAALRQLTDESRCPKCGLPRYRLRNRNHGWWHIRDWADFGYQRRCWDPEMIETLPDDELDARDRFLASRGRR